MSREAKLYLLDEPIGGVDPASRDYILKLLSTNTLKMLLLLFQPIWLQTLNLS